MKKIITLVVAVYLATIFACLFAQQVLPMDSAVRYGKLPNGLTYYIRHSDSNSGYVNMYLLQNVGSVLEEEHERGLAHVLEHMVFNGTCNFPGLTMRNYLDSKGLSFGTNYNASTSYDETVYKFLSIPTADSVLVDSCMMILRDMSSCLTLDDEMIAKERLIVASEWYNYDTPEMRARCNNIRKHFPYGEQYGTHFTIGSIDVINNFKPETLREFYRKWHRPDLQAVVIVGNVDEDWAETRIKELWADIPARENPVPRLDVEVPLHKGVLPIVEINKQELYNTLMLEYKIPDVPLEKKGTYEDYKLVVEYFMLLHVMKMRLLQMDNNNQSIFMGTEFSRSEYYGARWIDENYVISVVYPDKWQDAMRLLVKEIKRMREYGVGEKEFEQAKEMMYKTFESARIQTQNQVNSDFYEDIKTNFFSKEILVDRAQFYTVMIDILDTFTVADFNKHVAEAFSDDNIVVSLNGNEELTPIPTEQQLAQMYVDFYEQAEVEEVDDELVPLKPASNLRDTCEIVEQHVDSTTVNYYPTYHMTLSNGAKVILRNCDIETDKITLVAYRKGGAAMYNKDCYETYQYLDEISKCNGLGENKRDDINRWYMNSKHQYSIDFGDNCDVVTMESTINGMDDMLTHLQLLFCDPIKDEARFEQWKIGSQQMIASLVRSPEGIFRDSVLVAEFGYDNPYMPLYTRQPLNVDYQKACEMYSDIFSNASDFTFIMVGDMDEEQMKEYAIKYIGVIPGEKGDLATLEPMVLKSLPGSKVIDFECEGYDNELIKVDYKIVASIDYSGANKVAADMIEGLLEDYLIAELREKRGIVYTPNVSVSLYREPNNEVSLHVQLDVSPGYETLSVNVVDEFIEKLSKGEIPMDRYNAIKELLQRNADYTLDTANYPLNTALEEVMYGTSYERDERWIVVFLEEEDVVKVAKVLHESDCRKLVIMRPSVKK